MVISTYLEMLMGSVLIGAVGLMWSSVMKTTTTAVMATYGCLFLLFVLTMVGYGMRFSLAMGGGAGGGIFGTSVFAIYQSWFGSSFLGINVIEGVGFGVFCALVGVAALRRRHGAPGDVPRAQGEPAAPASRRSSSERVADPEHG